MSGVAIVRYLLANNVSLTAQVPATKIMGGAIPLGTVLPAISVAEISGIARRTVAMSEVKRLITERVQVTVETKTYPTQKSILKLVSDALQSVRGDVNGFDCDSILPDIESPDFYDEVAVIYMQSADFIVKFNR